jgi:hypothetical protein
MAPINFSKIRPPKLLIVSAGGVPLLELATPSPDRRWNRCSNSCPGLHVLIAPKLLIFRPSIAVPLLELAAIRRGIQIAI